VHVRLGVRAGPPKRIYSKAVRSRSAVKEGDDVMEIVIKEGSALASRDRGSKTDPFVELMYGSKRTKTQVIKRTLNPRWEHAVLFPYIPGEKLKLSCFDKDFRGKEFIGYVEICADEVANGGPDGGSDAWYKLQVSRLAPNTATVIVHHWARCVHNGHSICARVCVFLSLSAPRLRRAAALHFPFAY